MMGPEKELKALTNFERNWDGGGKSTAELYRT